MPIGTPFHSRTAPLCQSLAWRDWAGYFAASSYEVHPDREYNAIRNAAALIDVSPLFKYRVAGPDATRLVDRVITRDAAKLAVGQVAYTHWCDAAGNVIKEQPAGSKAFTKRVYDGAGRVTAVYTGYDDDESTYAEADDVTGDTIFEQVETSYDSGGNVIQTTSRQRFHNATGTGALTTPDGAQPKARVSHVASYPDAIGRVQAVANYGTQRRGELHAAQHRPGPQRHGAGQQHQLQRRRRALPHRRSDGDRHLPVLR